MSTSAWASTRKSPSGPVCPAVSRLDESRRKLNEAVDVCEVGHQPERDSHRSGAFSIDTHAEIVEREVGVLTPVG